MMKKILLIILTLLIVNISLTACSTKIVSPKDTMKPPAYTNDNSVKIMSDFRELINKSASPSEVIKFMKTNIAGVKKEDADVMVEELVKLQDKQIENYYQKLYSEEFGQALVKYEDKISENTYKDVKEENLRTLLDKIFKDGYVLSYLEGGYEISVNMKKLRDDYAAYTTPYVSDYLTVICNKYPNGIEADGCLNTTWDELAGGLVDTEKYINKYPGRYFTETVKSEHDWLLIIYLRGLDNTTAFDRYTNILKPEVLKSYENTVAKYKDSEVAGFVKQCLDELKKANYKKTDEYWKFINDYIFKQTKIKLEY